MNIDKYLSYGRAVAGIAHGNRAFGGPPQIRLSLTNRCNVRCIHCYFYSPLIERPMFFRVRQAQLAGQEIPDKEELKRLQKTDMDVDRMFPIFKEILSLGTRRFEFTGNGEPFVHPKALDVMGYLKQAGCHCQANTNGTLLRRRTLDRLIRMGFDELRITTMAGTSAVYRETHPGSPADTFDKLKSHLLYAAEQKRRLGRRRPVITLIMIVIRHNIDDMVNFAKFAAEVQAQNVWFRPVDDIEDEGLAQLVPDEREAQKVRRQLVEIKKYLAGEGIGHNIDFFLKVFREQLDTRELYRNIPCYYGWLDPEIGHAGQVYPCCRCYQVIGNVYDQGFAAVWNSNAYRRFRHAAKRIHRTGEAPQMCDCDSCINHTANLRVYRYLHPVKSRLSRMRRLTDSYE